MSDLQISAENNTQPGNIEWFINICKKNNFVISSEKLSLLEKYTHLLIQKNQKVNLISNKSEASVWEEHILHSVSFLFFIKFRDKSKILDLGCGGGLPGIPLKILFPDLDLVLIDSTKKKITAVQEMTSELGLKNIRAVSFRAEEINTNPGYYHSFDYVVARAVSSLNNIYQWSIPFLKIKSIKEKSCVPTGSIVVLKGGNLNEEIGQIKDKSIKNRISVIDLDFVGSDKLKNPDKKLAIFS